jgi:type IV pilus assembly protein PilV
MPMSSGSPPALHRRAQGFSLIELMVALIVVSLGLGGVLMAQARGYQALNGTGFRTQAALLAEQIMDRARANPTEAYTVSFGSTGGSGPTSVGDLSTWKAQLARTLPAGDGRITTTAQPDPTTGRSFERLEVVVGWDDRRAGAGDMGTQQMRYITIHGFRSRP